MQGQRLYLSPGINDTTFRVWSINTTTNEQVLFQGLVLPNLDPQFVYLQITSYRIDSTSQTIYIGDTSARLTIYKKDNITNKFYLWKTLMATPGLWMQQVIVKDNIFAIYSLQDIYTYEFDG